MDYRVRMSAAPLINSCETTVAIFQSTSLPQRKDKVLLIALTGQLNEPRASIMYFK